MLSVNFDVCFHFIGQWMHTFNVSAMKATHLIVAEFWSIRQCYVCIRLCCWLL